MMLGKWTLTLNGCPKVGEVVWVVVGKKDTPTLAHYTMSGWFWVKSRAMMGLTPIMWSRVTVPLKPHQALYELVWAWNPHDRESVRCTTVERAWHSGLTIITCSLCGRPAKMLSPKWPYRDGATLCEKHLRRNEQDECD